MKLNWSNIIAFVIVLGSSLTAMALKIEKLGIEDGLSNSNVISITQDREGFIWIATKDGLNRFNAHSFTVFRVSETNENSICSNVLNRVYADPFDNVVWIATEKNGVDAYNYKTRIFTHYEHDSSGENNSLAANGVTHIAGDGKGNLWLATYMAGIDYFDRQTGRFTNFSQENVKGLVSNYNWYVMPDSENRIYVGHVTEGLSIIDIETRTAVNYKYDPEDPNSLPDNTVTCIFKDSENRIWVGTRNGLALFDPVSGKMKNFLHDPLNPNSISYNFIESIIETKDSKLWIGTEGGGINIVAMQDLKGEINPRKVRFEHIPEAVTSDGLASASVQCVFQDSFGNIWVGGYGSGVNFILKKEPFFNTISYLPLIGNENSLNAKSVLGMCTDADENVWVANGAGGFCIYKNGKKTGQFNRVAPGSKPLFATCVYNDKSDDIWIGTDDGRIYRFDYETKQYHPLAVFDNLNNIPVYNFFEDSRQNLMFSTDIGLYVYNRRSGETKIITTGNSELTDDNVRAIAEDGKGNIWVGTLGGGLCVFDSNFGLLHDFGRRFPFYSVSCIYRDSRNRMWVGTQNDLFMFRDYDPEAVVRISTDSGLAEKMVRAVIEGQTADEIWLSTTNGISHIDLNTMQVSNFNVKDNIAYGDYLNAVVVKTSDGKIYFGSQNGITWFNQILEQTAEPLPRSSITAFAVTNYRDFNTRFTDIPFGNEVELKYYQNSFQISFNVLDYSLANKVEFNYQMKGLDEGWFSVNTGKEVTFRNLKPGNYVFNLKTRIQNSDWSDQITSLKVQIHPPLWFSWWMKLIYFMLALTILIFIVIFYKNKLKIENDLLLEKKSRHQENELNEEKLRFFTNITHELRSPLTLIIGPLEDLLSDGGLNPAQRNKLNTIQRVANRLLQTVNQILEFRKSESRSRKLTVIKDDLAKYIYEIGEKYKRLNQNENIEVQIEIPDRRVEMYFDPDVITIIMDNLLSNAFKYTREGIISLELKLTQEDNIDFTEIIVSDTGYGISEMDLPKIFERYYQAKNAQHPVKGTGIGLSLVKNMVELHEAEIFVSSRVNEGSEFRVRFLTNNSYPDAIHYYPEDIQHEETEENAKKVILVVDDDHEIVDYIKDSLSGKYTVLTAENGKIGYETACSEIPDIVISDVMMPIMDGIEMCRLMKSDVRTSHIPVVLLTAKGSLHDQKTGYDAGADSYLTKPFSSNLLRSRLKNILDARKKYSLASASKFKQKQELLNESIGELDKEFLKNLTKVIEENLEDEEMNISYVAAQLNMSHSTLYRKIKALTNLTANEFIRKVRINYAEQLLLTGQYNISEIMYRVGINSSSYFRQCFKDEFGMNPSEYLQKLKEG